MKNVNEVTLSGNLVRDFKCCESNFGSFLANRIAYNKPYQDAEGNWQSHAHYFDLQIRVGPLQQSVTEQSLLKGDFVEIDGSLHSREDGSVFINVARIALIARSKKNNQETVVETSGETVSAVNSDEAAVS